MDRKMRAVDSWIALFVRTIVFALPILTGLVILLAFLPGCNHHVGSKWAMYEQIRPATNTARLIKNADYLKKSGRIELAVKELEEAHLQDPGNLKILDVLIQCYEQLGHFERAQELYAETLSRVGQHPALENNRCYSLYLEGRFAKAEACFRKVLARHPGNQTARNNLGLVLCRQGRDTEALALWREAFNDVEARQRLGQAIATLGREVPPSLAGPPLVAADTSSKPPEKKKARSEKSQPSTLSSPTASPVPAIQPPATPVAASPSPPVPIIPEVATVVPQRSGSSEPQAQLHAKATTPSPPTAASLKPAVTEPNPTTAKEINQGSLKEEKPIATEGSTDTAAALASSYLPQSSLPEKSVAKTYASASEPTSTSKMDVKQQRQASVTASTTKEQYQTQMAVPTPPVSVSTPPSEPKKESVTLAEKPPIDENTQTPTSLNKAKEQQVSEPFRPLKQLVARLLALIRKEEATAAQVSPVPENTQTLTPVKSAHELPKTQTSPTLTVARADSQPSKKEESAASSTQSSINKTVQASTMRQPVKEPSQSAVSNPPITVAASSYVKKIDSTAFAPKPSINKNIEVSKPHLSVDQLLDTRIELKNGNGVQNQAREARSRLLSEGFTVVSIGNHIDFGLEKTVIAYRPEAVQVAEVLSQRFFPGANLEKEDNISRGVDIRVSLGRDLMPGRGELAQVIP